MIKYRKIQQQKTINNYSESIKFLVRYSKLQIDELKDEIMLIECQMLQLYNKYSLQTKLTKQQFKQKQVKEEKQFHQQNNHKKNDLKAIKRCQNKKSNIQIVKKLQNIIENLSLHQIQQQLQINYIYKKIGDKNVNNANFSSNAHRLAVSSKMQINFEQLIKQQFITVQCFWHNNKKISLQHLKLLLSNLNNIFPNLKMLTFGFCQLNDNHWRIIIDCAEQLKNIQAFNIVGNIIQHISQQDLQRLLVIKELKVLFLLGTDLSNKSKQILEKFKQKHKQIRVVF